MTNLKIGVVGHGYWGSKVYQEYVDLIEDDSIAEVHVCDTNPKRISSIKSADGTWTATKEMIEYVDAIHVCTHNATHYEIAKSAIENETDVLLEKPLTTNRRTAFDLVELASQHGRILQTGHIFRFANVIRKIQSLIEEHHFGEIYQYNLSWTHYIDPIDGTDVLWDLLCHPIDILNFITGSWPTDACGYATSHRRNEGSESAQVLLQFPRAMAGIQVSWVNPVRRRHLEIVGSTSSLQAECVKQKIHFHDEDSSKVIDIESNNTIRAEAENFIRAIETNKNAYNSAIVGARTVDAIEMINETIKRL